MRNILGTTCDTAPAPVAGGRIAPIALMATVLVFGAGATASASADSPASPSTGGTDALVTPVEEGPEDEPISRDKVIVVDDAPAPVVPEQSGDEHDQSGDTHGEADTPAAAEETGASMPVPPTATDATSASTRSPSATGMTTPTAPASTSAPVMSATSPAMVTVTSASTPMPASASEAPSATRTRAAEAPLRPRPWTPYPVPAETTPARATGGAAAGATSSVPALAKGIKGIRAAEPMTRSEPALNSTALGLFGLSLIAAGATLLAVLRTRARR